MSGYLCVVIAAIFHVAHVVLGAPALEGMEQAILAQGPIVPQIYLPWRRR